MTIQYITDPLYKIAEYSKVKLTSVIDQIPLKLYGMHFFILFVLYQVFSLTGLTGTTPTNSNLLQWDTGWYVSIMHGGYHYYPGQQCNLAFYPLFPYLWRVLHLSAVGMSIFNLILMLSGLSLLRQCFHINLRTLLLALSAPCLFFCYVPYSEGLFFFSCSLFLYGLKYDKAHWTCIGLAIACLTRSASPTLIPAILLCMILNMKRETLVRDIAKTSLLLLVSISGIMIVQIVQYWQTGYWFKFFEVQSRWGRIFNLPVLFLTTWGDKDFIWLDGLAFFVGASSLAAIIYLIRRKLKNRSKTIDRVILFSMGYLMMTMFVVLFWGPVYIMNYGTSIYSLNRFVFATPFFTVFLCTFRRYIRFEYQTILVFLLMADVVGFLFGAFTGIQQFMYWALATGYVFLYLWLGHSRINKEIWTFLYILNIIFQLWLFNSFLNGGGVI